MTRRRHKAPCRDCRTDTLDPRGAEYYMVTDEVWAQAGMTKAGGGFLCIGCLSARLGRPLNGRDLTDALVNQPWFGFGSDTPRLAALKLAAALGRFTRSQP